YEPTGAEEPMADFSEQILALVRRRNYQPLKPKALARKLGAGAPAYPEVKRALRGLPPARRLELCQNHPIPPLPPHRPTTPPCPRWAPAPSPAAAPAPASASSVLIRSRARPVRTCVSTRKTPSTPPPGTSCWSRSPASPTGRTCCPRA